MKISHPSHDFLSGTIRLSAIPLHDGTKSHKAGALRSAHIRYSAVYDPTKPMDSIPTQYHHTSARDFAKPMRSISAPH